MRTAAYPDIEGILLTWFKAAQAENVPVSGPILQEKGVALAKKLGYMEFICNDGWLDHFETGHGIVSYAVRGEGAEVTIAMTDDWLQGGRVHVLNEHASRDVFNQDETRQFYTLLPDCSLIFKGETYNGEKQSRECVTAMVCANIDGIEKLPPLVIGKSKKPHCFWNVKTQPTRYETNKTAWLISRIFEAWIRKVDKTYQ
ncbi:tigger transposable element-derived protein 4-like [Carcharodon carcharias]|uniref:tigger transposable element-derived protein 4-like n=1 Tax=Carcharodon carcharias TaxID=13397 RepID=UPI001B7DA35E|nr:tigger transposable element-derived protein 4-like [Carcharodon carcharias]XP_041058278.1 tigger transposable element-derived protein 4-like [Carcharodon carcharias]XP_041058279.1 tigger transposable element-derived protein 4-like [Carcharodon carcharias]